MGVSGGRPDVVKARQGEVDRGDRGGEMPDRSDAADGEAGVLSHEVGISAGEAHAQGSADARGVDPMST